MSQPVTEAPAVAPAVTPASHRLLPMSHLLRLTMYWFGITAIWQGLNSVVLPTRLDALDPAIAGTMNGLIQGAGVLMAIAVQPTIGMVSDYTVTRWGRRKPYILIGTLLDVVFLVGVATSQTYLAIAAFVVLLQFSSNFAQGPFQGYVPDLVAEEQVGRASGLMGLMILLGNIGGGAIATVGLLLIPGEDAGAEAVRQAFFWPTVGLGIIELATMLGVVLVVEDTRRAPSRAGRSWLSVARSAWARDILSERNVLRVLFVRLFFLASTGAVIGFAVFFLRRSLGLSDGEVALWFNVALFSVGLISAAVAYPAARASDRYGRKPLIYLSCLLGALGVATVVVAPNVGVALAGFVPIGIANGMFLSVDWALMTDVIPKDTTGRYMGILNIGTAAAGPIALLSGGLLMDTVRATVGEGAGPRAAYALAIVFLAGCAWVLTRVDPRRREGGVAHGG